MLNYLKRKMKAFDDAVVIPSADENDRLVRKFFSAEQTLLTLYLWLGIFPSLAFPLAFVAGHAILMYRFIVEPSFSYPASSVTEVFQFIALFISCVSVPVMISCYHMFRRLGRTPVNEEEYSWMYRCYRALGFESPRWDMTKRDLSRYVEKAVKIKASRVEELESELR